MRFTLKESEDMKIRYWNHNSYQMLPLNWDSSKLIKPHGLIHDDPLYRRIVNTVRRYEHHVFLVNGLNREVLEYDCPENVIPILQCTELNMGNADYPYISLFVQRELDLSLLNTHTWYLLSGNKFDLLEPVVKELSRRRIPFYTEYFKGSRMIENVPIRLRRRQIPRHIVTRLVGCEFNSMIGG